MKKALLITLMALAISLVGAGTQATTPVKVDVLFMNHGPLLSTINKMKMVFSEYGDRVNVSWHDFETKDGEQFMAKMGIKQHIPLVIWINGTQNVMVGAKQVTFAGFPTGSGPPSFQGRWTMDDLKTALSQATGSK